MSTPLIVNGVTYQYPVTRDVDWGQQATAWAAAVTSGMLQKAGGSFPLTAEVDFGGSFGIKVKSLKSRAANVAAAGIVRLGNTESIGWRDQANGADVRIYVDSDDKLYYQNGVDTPIDLTAAAAGNVTGPGSSTTNAIAKYADMSGQLLADSDVLIDGSDNVSGINDLTMDGDLTVGPDAIEILKALPPIGFIMPFYDFNGDLTVDPAYWVPCDGTVQTVGGVSRTTPDLSGRYLVGFGTDGAGDVDTAPWATTPVGNAGHTVNLQHSHTVNSHTHTMAHTHTINAHSHTVDSHTHGTGSFACSLDFDSGTSQLFYQTFSGGFTANHKIGSITDDGSSSSVRTNNIGIHGNSAAATPGTSSVGLTTNGSSAANTGAATPGTDSQLSTTQSIQPRSIRVRYYMRAA